LRQTWLTYEYTGMRLTIFEIIELCKI
jgi:hypothetical protein